MKRNTSVDLRKVIILTNNKETKLQFCSLATSRKDFPNRVKNFYKKLFSNTDSLPGGVTLDTVIDKEK